MGKSKDNIRQGLVGAIVVLYIVGALLLPDGTLRSITNNDSLLSAMGLMYVFYGAFAFPCVLFSIMSNDLKGIASKMTLAFYYSITLLFVIISIKSTEFILSSFILILIMATATYLIMTDDTK